MRESHHLKIISRDMSHLRRHTDSLFVCLSFTSLQHRGHLEMAPPFTVPCEGRAAREIHCSNRESYRGSSCGRPLRYRCATTAPHIRTEKVKQREGWNAISNTYDLFMSVIAKSMMWYDLISDYW